MRELIYMFQEGDYLSLMINIMSKAFVVFCCLPLHELAHAFAASKCGDDTARLQGRLTVNPFAHLDIVGTLMIFFFGIGYAKPVPVNYAKLKHPRKDMALIALAGPVSNMLMSFVSVFIFFAMMKFGGENLVINSVAYFFYYAAMVNASLAVFNLLPVPPLDGSRVASAVLPDKIYFKIMKYERYIMIGLFALLFFGVFDGLIGWLSNALMKVISFIPSLIFGVSF